MERERIFYFDFLRIFAALAVVMLHTAASQYGLSGIYHYSSCFWDGLVRWGVPVFVMISGALFLEPAKQITISNVLKKYVFRIAVLFVVWSLFYTCINCVLRNNFSFSFILTHLITGHFHQWFLYMIAGLYLITPLLRCITEKKDKILLLYLLVLWLVMASIVPFIKFIIPQTENLFNIIMSKKLLFYFPLSYVGYFVLGYYLHNYINIKSGFLIIILLFSLLFIVSGDIVFSTSSKASFFLNNFCPFVIFVATSMFLIAKNKYLKIKQSNKIILNLSGLTLGVYLIHPFFIGIAKELNLFSIINSTLNDNNFLTIPILFVLISFCSFFAVYLLSKISFVKKYCL